MSKVTFRCLKQCSLIVFLLAISMSLIGCRKSRKEEMKDQIRNQIGAYYEVSQEIAADMLAQSAKVAAEQQAEWERKEAQRKADQEARRIEEERIEAENSFTTSDGSYKIDYVLDACYKEGVSAAELYIKTRNYSNVTQYTKSKEEQFKDFWGRRFGIPNNDKAKYIYKQAFQKFEQGWTDAIGFYE